MDMMVSPSPCPSGTGATACFDATITNHGSVAGGGSCTLFGEIHRTAYPGSESEPGQTLLVATLKGGAVAHMAVQWHGPERDAYRGLCEPGLQS